MARKESKPAEYKSFESLTQKLLQVPKADLDKKIQVYEDDKKKKQAKEKKA